MLHVAMQTLQDCIDRRYEKVEQQKQGMKKAAELERRFAKKDGAAPDGAAADGAAASSDSDSDQDDEDKITETEEAGKIRMCTLQVMWCMPVQICANLQQTSRSLAYWLAWAFRLY